MKRPGELFVGVGVGSYTHLAALPRAVADVREVAEALGFAQAPPLVNPDDTEVRDFLGTFDGRLPGGGTLVTYWSGHGALRGDTLRLMTSNDDSRPKGMAVADVLLPLAESGANQLLFIFDAVSYTHLDVYKRQARAPCSSATSTSRTELDELREPTTIIRSTSRAICLTASLSLIHI